MSEIFSRFPVLMWNGDEASQDWICVVVCPTWVTRAGYSASTRVVTSQTAPPIRTKASSSVHQVARERAEPAPPQPGRQRLEQRGQQDRGGEGHDDEVEQRGDLARHVEQRGEQQQPPGPRGADPQPARDGVRGGGRPLLPARRDRAPAGGRAGRARCRPRTRAVAPALPSARGSQRAKSRPALLRRPA